MKRNIRNIFAKQDYTCFGCSPNNPIGMNLKFYEEDGYIKTTWHPTKLHEGYPNSVHGGLQATLLDEVAGWALYVQAACAGVTARMNIRYHKQVNSNQEKIILQARVKEKKMGLAFIEAQLLDEQGNLCTEAEVTYFTFSKEKSVNEYYFPLNPEEFYEK